MFKYIVDGDWFTGDENALRQYAPTMIPHKGVFETLRTYKGVPFLLDDHIARAKKGLSVLGFALPCSEKKIYQEVLDVVSISRRNDLRLRLSFWSQQGRMHYAITASPFKALSEKDYSLGFQVMFVRRQREETSKYSEVKSLDYDDYLSAYRRAKMHHCDEALLINQLGHVYEGSRTNIFVVKDGCIQTPLLDSGCLNGIARRQVIKLVRQKKWLLKEIFLSKNDVLNADEIFLTNSMLAIMPVTMVEGAEKPVGSITEELRKRYQTILASS